MIFKPDPKPIKVIKKKSKYQWKRKPTGEKELFLEIWEERPHHSQISGLYIHQPTPSNFLHVIPKAQNKYPKFKLNKQNIIIGTEDEHYYWDHNRKDIENDPKWAFMFELEASLKEQYKLL
jgi:hypothetical protein